MNDILTLLKSLLKFCSIEPELAEPVAQVVEAE